MTPGLDAAIAAAAQAESHATVATLPVVPGRVLHVDGDYLAYFAAGNDDMPAGVARQVCAGRIEQMQAASGAEKVLLHLTADCSHKGMRYAIATVKPYQGNRTGKSKPKNWSMLREFMELGCGDRFPVRMSIDREADDSIAQAAHTSRDEYAKCVISTTDKDMRMLPGLHLDWKSYKLTHVPADDYCVIGENGLTYGWKWFFLQLLQGDAADNCPGLEQYVKVNGKTAKVGEATALTLLENCSTPAHAAVAVEKHYLAFYGDSWADRLNEQAMLMWLRRGPSASVLDYLGYWPGYRADLTVAANKVLARIYAEAKGE